MPTMKGSLAGLAIAASASPSFGRSADNRNTNSAREAAIHGCSVEASKCSNTMWQASQFHAYSNCMIDHGQRPDALPAAGLRAARPASGPTQRKVGACMRKNISFTVAATIFGLGMMVWATSAVVATQAGVTRPPVGASTYVVISNLYLPIHVLDEIY
jgi:hypothetical protein